MAHLISLVSKGGYRAIRVDHCWKNSGPSVGVGKRLIPPAQHGCSGIIWAEKSRPRMRMMGQARATSYPGSAERGTLEDSWPRLDWIQVSALVRDKAGLSSCWRLLSAHVGTGGGLAGGLMSACSMRCVRSMARRRRTGTRTRRDAPPPAWSRGVIPFLRCASPNHVRASREGW